MDFIVQKIIHPITIWLPVDGLGPTLTYYQVFVLMALTAVKALMLFQIWKGINSIYTCICLYIYNFYSFILHEDLVVQQEAIVQLALTFQ
jgi:hypothetical protein